MKTAPDLYSFLHPSERPKVVWPGGAKLAFWVAPNVEYYELQPPVHPTRRLSRPVPDVAYYSSREYGNRIGHWRLLDAMDDCGIRGSVSLSAAMIDHHPEIISSCVARDWEFFSHGIYNTRYSTGMDEGQEAELLQDSIRSIQAATGQRIRGYLSPALSTTEATMDLLSENDFWYTCDLFHDDQPQPVRTRSGRPLVSIPYSIEVNDYIAYAVYMQTPRAYADVLKRQFDQLLTEGAQNGSVMCIPLHGYLVGRPQRIDAFHRVLEYITSHGADVWMATGAEIARFYLDTYYDATLTAIENSRESRLNASRRAA